MGLKHAGVAFALAAALLAPAMPATAAEACFARAARLAGVETDLLLADQRHSLSPARRDRRHPRAPVVRLVRLPAGRRPGAARDAGCGRRIVRPWRRSLERRRGLQCRAARSSGRAALCPQGAGVQAALAAIRAVRARHAAAAMPSVPVVAGDDRLDALARQLGAGGRADD